MTKQRRSFSAEFKRESALRRWVNQLQQERSGVTPQTKALTPDKQKI